MNNFINNVTLLEGVQIHTDWTDICNLHNIIKAGGPTDIQSRSRKTAEIYNYTSVTIGVRVRQSGPIQSHSLRLGTTVGRTMIALAKSDRWFGLVRVGWQCAGQARWERCLLPLVVVRTAVGIVAVFREQAVRFFNTPSQSRVLQR